MTREETKKCIEVMQAYVDGKTVGYMRNDGNGTLFFSESKSPAWNWFHENYIVKPQSMKVTQEEKEIISKLPIFWAKHKETGEINSHLGHAIKSFKKDHYILNSETMEWEDWSEDADSRHHYNGGQP